VKHFKYELRGKLNCRRRQESPHGLD